MLFDDVLVVIMMVLIDSAKCVDETKSFITSIIVGKDVVPR